MISEKNPLGANIFSQLSLLEGEAVAGVFRTATSQAKIIFLLRSGNSFWFNSNGSFGLQGKKETIADLKQISEGVSERYGKIPDLVRIPQLIESIKKGTPPTAVADPTVSQGPNPEQTQDPTWTSASGTAKESAGKEQWTCTPLGMGIEITADEWKKGKSSLAEDILSLILPFSGEEIRVSAERIYRCACCGEELESGAEIKRGCCSDCFKPCGLPEKERDRRIIEKFVGVSSAEGIPRLGRQYLSGVTPPQFPYTPCKPPADQDKCSCKKNRPGTPTKTKTTVAFTPTTVELHHAVRECALQDLGTKHAIEYFRAKEARECALQDRGSQEEKKDLPGDKNEAKPS